MHENNDQYSEKCKWIRWKEIMISTEKNASELDKIYNDNNEIMIDK